MYKYYYLILILFFLTLNTNVINGLISVTTLSISTVTTNSIMVLFTVGPATNGFYRYFINGTRLPSLDNSVTNNNIPGLTPGETYIVGVCATETFGSCTIQRSSAPIFVYNNATFSSTNMFNINSNGMMLNWTTINGAPSLPYRYTIAVNKTALSTKQTQTNFTITTLQPSSAYEIDLTLYNDDDIVTKTWMVETYPSTTDDSLNSILKSRTTKTLTINSRLIGGLIGQTEYTVTDLSTTLVIPGCEDSLNEDCLVSGLTPNTTYSYEIKAVNGPDSFVKQYEFTTYMDITVPTVTLTNQTTNTLQVSYESLYGIPNETLYTVQLDGINVTECTNTQNKNCDIIDLIESKSYTIRVIAENDGKIVHKDTTFSTLGTINLNILNRTTRLLNVSFSANNSPIGTKYTIVLDGQNYTGCTEIDTNTCLISNLNPSTIYEVQVITMINGVLLETTQLFATITSVSAPEIKVYQKLNQTLEIQYSSQYGYGPSVYEVTINGTLLSECTNDSVPCLFYPYSFNSTYEIIVKVSNDGTEKSSSQLFKIFNLPTAVNINSTSTISSISITWNESQEGFPNSTYYSASLSNSFGDHFIIFCDNVTSLLQCNFTSLISNTTYSIRVSVFNSFFEPINTTIQVSTLFESNQYCTTDIIKTECNGNGDCINNQCQCKSGWTGQYCETTNPTNNNPNITPNPDNPIIVIDDKGIEYTFSINQISEIDQMNNIIKSLNTSSLKWTLINNSDRNINNQINGVVLEKSWQYTTNSHQDFKSINIIFYQYLSIPTKTQNDYYQYEYGGQTYSIKLGSFKYTFNVSEWNFNSRLNSIQLESTVTSPLGGSCNDETKLSTSNNGNNQLIILSDDNGNSVFGRLSNTVILDDIPRLISHKISQSNDNNKDRITIFSVIPYFSDTLFFDPDFESLISVDGPAECSKDDNKWRIIVGAVVGGFVGVSIVAASVFLLHRKKRFNKQNKNMEAKLQKLK